MYSIRNLNPLKLCSTRSIYGRAMFQGPRSLTNSFLASSISGEVLNRRYFDLIDVYFLEDENRGKDLFADTPETLLTLPIIRAEQRIRRDRDE